MNIFNCVNAERDNEIRRPPSCYAARSNKTADGWLGQRLAMESKKAAAAETERVVVLIRSVIFEQKMAAHIVGFFSSKMSGHQQMK